MQKRKSKSVVVIYAIYFPISNKSYIGQTQNLRERIEGHLEAGSFVGRALRKYKDWVVIELHVADNEWANTLEIAEIAWHNSLAPNGYNLTMGGEGTRVLKWSGESRKKWSKNNPSHRLEVREKISKAKKGKKNPKLSEALKGRKCPGVSESNRRRKGEKNPGVGRALKGRKRPKECIRKWLATRKKNALLRGYWHSEETKRKIGLGNRKEIQ